MTLIELPDLLQASDAWHDQRRGIVTASVVGQLITTKTLYAADVKCPECGATSQAPCLGKARRPGEAPTPIKTMHAGRAEAARNDEAPPQLVPAANDDSRALTYQLVAERIAGWTDPTYTNSDMFRGNMEEPRARDLYSEHYEPVRESGFMLRDEGTWKLGYSPDGLVGDDGLIEVKAPRSKAHLRTILSGEVPPYHMPQLQAGLLVSGRQWVDFISWCGGMPMWVKRVEPDERWFDAITTAVTAFEMTAAQMVADYERATQGLFPTERIDYDAEIQVAA